VIYHEVPKLGRSISALSFGCMRFHDPESAAASVCQAIDLSINYFDVAPGYGGGTAEPYLALGLKERAIDDLIITAKSSPGDGGEGVGQKPSPEIGFGINSAELARVEIERSMSILGVDHLEVYHLWAVHSNQIFDEAIRPGGFLDGVVQARADGLIDHIGITAHLNGDDCIRALEMFDFPLLTIPFNLRDTSRAKAVDYCAAKGIGVIAMNPVGGGTLARKSPVLQRIANDLGFESMTEAAIRFAAFYPGVTTALNGISFPEQALEGAAAVEKGPIPSDVCDELQRRVQELYSNVKHFCTACGYCGECPEGILIPRVLESYSNMLVPSIADAAADELRDALAANPEGLDPSKCVACKICESKCPNHLPISELMADAATKWPSV